MSSSLSETTLGDLFIAPLHPSDFEENELSNRDLKYLRAFENAWEQFIAENPHHLPIGYQQADIQDLRSELSEIEAIISAVKDEMKSQLSYFQKSRMQLEQLHEEKQIELFEKRREMEEELSEILDLIAVAEQLQNQTLTWTNFLMKLDKAIPQLRSDGVDGDDYPKWRQATARPSDRALSLSKEVSGSLLHSYRIDRALLTSHVSMLRKEIQRVENMHHGAETVGEILKECNAWSIINTTEESFGPGEFIATMASTSPRKK